MGYFRDTEHLYEVLGAFFDEVRFHPEMGPRLRESRLVVRFVYTDPEGVVTINFVDPPQEEGAFGFYEFGEEVTREPDVTMKQSADFSHRFWHGKVNVIRALATRQIVASGSVQKALKLLPAIRPSFALYPEVLRRLGYEEMIL